MVSKGGTLTGSYTTSKGNTSSSLRCDKTCNVFEGNTYKYILTNIQVASRYKVARPLGTKKSSEVALELKAIYKKGSLFKYPKIFKCDNGSEFKNEVTKLLEKRNADIRRATTK